MIARDPVETALRFVACINNHDLDALVAMLAHGHLFVDLAEAVHEFDAQSGRKAWQGYFGIAPSYQIHITETHAIGDMVVLAGGTTGSHLRLPDAEEIKQKLLWVAKVEAERISEWRLLYDTPVQRGVLGVPLG